MKAVWVIGSGGHAKVVIDTLRADGRFLPAGVLDDDPSAWGAEVLGVAVRGEASPESVRRLGVEWAVVAVGSNRDRRAVVARLAGSVSWATAVHPAAYVAATAALGEGTVVMAGAVVQPDAAVGNHVILNTSCSVDHDSRVGDFVHVAPGARLAGGVRVGEGALLGVGAAVAPGRSVGGWATVGAGGVVVRDVADGAVVKGVPARG